MRISSLCVLYYVSECKSGNRRRFEIAEGKAEAVARDFLLPVPPSVKKYEITI